MQEAPVQTLGYIHPQFYPDDGGYPFLNAAIYFNLPYDRVLNDDVPDAKPVCRARVALLHEREAARKAGLLGPLNGKS